MPAYATRRFASRDQAGVQNLSQDSERVDKVLVGAGSSRLASVNDVVYASEQSSLEDRRIILSSLVGGVTSKCATIGKSGAVYWCPLLGICLAEEVAPSQLSRCT
jgi:hypothetical protein